MRDDLFGSELWQPALAKYSEATALSVALYGADGKRVGGASHPTPLFALFQEFGFEPVLLDDCARRCLAQGAGRAAVVVVAEARGLTVVGTSLILDGNVVGVAVAGYALAEFVQVPAVRRWASEAGVPFDRLWQLARGLPPLPARRIKLHGELLQVLGDALLRENHRTRQYEEAASELRAASAAKDEFLAVLSHELRTPLAAIHNWVNVLKRDQSPQQVQRGMDAIERNVRLQTRMIEDLLDVTRIARGTVQLDLAVQYLPALVRAALEASEHEIEKKAIVLEVADSGEPLFVEGDAGRLQQVFMNIVSNAVKFTPAGGHIRVLLTREAGAVLIAVADSGKGIAPEFLPHVFEMFRQQEHGTRRDHDGLGIGLALVQRLVELHQGTIKVASAGVGLGTEVTVRLPLSRESTALVEATAALAGERAGCALDGISVLVVEDSKDSRESLRDLLQLLGATVSVAADGRDGLDRVADSHPDLVLCDLRMPRMDGFEFIHALHGAESPHRPPVVAMSGLASEADHRRTREAGFESHIAKPFDEATVVAALGKAFNERRGSAAGRAAGA